MEEEDEGGIIMKPKTLKLAGEIGNVYRKDPGHAWVEVKSKDIMAGLEKISKVTDRISDISCYDTGKGLIEVMYRFNIDNDFISIKTRLNSEKPRIPTCTRLFPGALLIEREQHEQFGVWFNGHRGLDRVFFADSTPKTPLRKPSKEVEKK